MQRNIVFFSHSLGQLKTGVSKNFKHIKPLLSSKNNIHNVSCTNNLFNNLKDLYKINSNIDKKHPVINIGGDHSMSIATVASSLNKYKDLKVIWIDAHADINTYNSSSTKNYHGMPLSYLTSLDHNNKFDFINNKLPFSNLLYIGVRDLDYAEKKFIDKYNIKLLTVENIRNEFHKSIDTIHDFIDESPVHLSIDVDALDPCFMPSTGTPVKNGLYLSEIQQMIAELYKHNVINVDIAELNLEDYSNKQNELSLNNFLDILTSISSKQNVGYSI